MRLSVLASMVLLLSLVARDVEAKHTFTVTANGFGPVRFGMKVEQAEKVLGVRLVQDDYNDYDSCRYFTSASGFTGVLFMTSMRKIVRVDVDTLDDAKASPTATETDKGAKIGDSEARVVALYAGRIKVGPHFYTGPEGHYLRVYDATGKVRLIFETDGKKVLSYRAGHEPAVEYVEGCQ